jgi:hypothetical protein
MISEQGDTCEIVTEPAVWRNAIVRGIKEAGNTSDDPISSAKRNLALAWIKGERVSYDECADDDERLVTRLAPPFFISFSETCELAGLDHAKVYEYAFDAISAAPRLPVARMTVPTLAELALNPPKLTARAPNPKQAAKRAHEPRRLAPGMHNARLITFNGKELTLSDWGRSLGIGMGTLSARLRARWTIEEALTIPLGQSRPRANAPERKPHKSERPVTHDGRTQSLSAWAREVGIAMPTLHRRLNAGWSVEAAFTCPVIRPNPVKPKEAGPIGGKPRVFLTHDGRTQALFEWARETGIQVRTLWHRVNAGWSDKEVLTTPIRATKAPKARATTPEDMISTPGVGQNFSESAPDRSVPVARYTA